MAFIEDIDEDGDIGHKSISTPKTLNNSIILE
jgi:hypothetical protein